MGPRFERAGEGGGDQHLDTGARQVGGQRAEQVDRLVVVELERRRAGLGQQPFERGPQAGTPAQGQQQVGLGLGPEAGVVALPQRRCVDHERGVDGRPQLQVDPERVVRLGRHLHPQPDDGALAGVGGGQEPLEVGHVGQRLAGPGPQPRGDAGRRRARQRVRDRAVEPRHGHGRRQHGQPVEPSPVDSLAPVDSPVDGSLLGSSRQCASGGIQAARAARTWRSCSLSGASTQVSRPPTMAGCSRPRAASPTATRAT